MKKIYCVLVIVLAIAGIQACKKIIPSVPEDNEILDGPVEGLKTAEQARFLNGDIGFNDQVFTVSNGLGPVFVATSCGSCHAGDGKGHPFTTLTRFGQTDSTGNSYLLQGGPQLQNKAIPGYTPEQIPAGATSSKFTPPANTGLGFLSALSDAQIMSNADPMDNDADGISGVPNYISAPAYFYPKWYHQSYNGKYIGRFGKKAAAIDLMQQTVNAYNQDMGITSSYFPTDAFSGEIIQPEVDEKTILDVVFYLRTLKAPVQRDVDNAEVIEGMNIFTTIGCAKCHTREWTTPNSDIAALSNKTFHPYTDLLLHDMGTELDDNYTEGMASTAEWKTPALWGVGLSPGSQGGGYFLLHDGRAHSIQEAILLHGGESLMSRNSYLQLTSQEQQLLVKFLESL